MSRTHHHTRGYRYKPDYWGRYNCNKHGGVPSTDGKKAANKERRALSKKIIDYEIPIE